MWDIIILYFFYIELNFDQINMIYYNLHEIFFLYIKKLTNNISNAYPRRITGSKTSESLHIQVKSRY